ncbi:hypothetical protein [Mariniblastus fucicola]|uniref:Streptomycin adenylyltransferase n=1 Tax=Mariniblastus fucicola TaxID=980251 RepID=A0A5B9PFI4_9BACT|nr:hypothetical protein [Mariniblastus fucicola]QEG25198.1 hypothetical protein MFFC18_51220 [Mariniblastus fucicola]
MIQKPVVAETLESLLQSLQNSFDDKLVSVVHYGPLVGKDLESLPTVEAEIQVLIVVKDLVEADWTRLSQAFDRLRGRASVFPLLLTEHELKSSADVFPIMLREMKRNHRTIYGDDFVDGIEVQRSHLRLRCEQELRSLQLRMQSICLMHFASPHRLRASLVRDYDSFMPLLKVAIELGGDADAQAVEPLEFVARKFELELETLFEARSIATDNGHFDEESFGHQYVELMSAVRHSADFVDQLPDA